MAERAEMFREPTLYDGPLPRLGVRRRTQAVSAQKAAPAPRLFVERAAWNAVLLRPKRIEGYGRQPEIGWLPPRTTGPLDVLRPVPGDGWRGSAVLRLGVHADAMMIDELPAFPAGVEKQQDGGER